MIYRNNMGLKLIILFFTFNSQGQIYLPINCENRKDIANIQLTDIGQFGIKRKTRANFAEHFHTGIDIKRPNNNYINEPIFPIAEGKVISKRTDGPYANLVIEHTINGLKFWTLYEHIAGIHVKVNDIVNPQAPIARFMNKAELNENGWQFNHFHLEIVKKKPREIKPDKIHPEKLYSAYTLVCYTSLDLQKYYFDPIIFFQNYLN